MITKALPGGEKPKETSYNKEFKTFCSGQLRWVLTDKASCADVRGSWYGILETCTPALAKFTARFLPNNLM